MNDKIAIFIDFDGTLYDNATKSIPESTIKTLEKYHDKFDLFLATGRSKFIIGPLRPYMSLFKGCVLMNGDYVIYNGKTIRDEHFSQNDVELLIKSCQEEKVVLALPTIERCYITRMDDFLDKVLDGKDEESIIDIKGYNFDTTLPYNMAWVLGDREPLEKVAEKVPSLDFVLWGKYGGDVLSKGHSKYNGVKAMLDAIPYPKDKTYAIGNGDNDLEMFDLVGTSIAMGNSSDKALKKADYITDDIQKDGFQKAFEYLEKINK